MQKPLSPLEEFTLMIRQKPAVMENMKHLSEEQQRRVTEKVFRKLVADRKEKKSDKRKLDEPYADLTEGVDFSEKAVENDAMTKEKMDDLYAILIEGVNFNAEDIVIVAPALRITVREP